MHSAFSVCTYNYYTSQMDEGADTEIFPLKEAKVVKEKQKISSTMEDEM